MGAVGNWLAHRMGDSVPYYKDYQANITRGVVAAVCCAGIFIIYAILERFLLRKEGSTRGARVDVSTITSSYSKDKGATLHGVGVDNMALDKRERFTLCF